MKDDLSGFHRAKVIDVDDSQMVGYIGVHLTELMSGVDNDIGVKFDHLEKNKEINMIIAKPMFHYDEGVDAYANDTVAGSFRMPNKGSYVVVFFLNHDYANCYYLPNMTIPYYNQSISGETLSLEDKSDFYDISRKHKVILEQFYNKTVIGFNSNDDVNKLFINFDGGSSIQLEAPNEESSIKSTKKSNTTKPTKLKLSIKRFDSQYSSDISIKSDNDESTITQYVEKNPHGVSHGSDFINNDTNPEYYRSSMKLFTDKDSSGYSAYSKYKLDDNTYSNSSFNHSSNNESSEIKYGGYFSYDNTKSSYNVESIIGKNGVDVTRKTEYVKDKLSDKITNIDEKSNISDGLIYKTVELLNKMTNKIFLTFKSISETATTYFKKVDTMTVTSTEFGKEYVSKSSSRDIVSKDEVSSICNKHKSYKYDTNLRYETEYSEIVTDEENSFKMLAKDDNFTNEFKMGVFRKIVMGNVVEEYVESSNTMSVKTPNPADVSRSLGLGALKEKGHKISTKVTENGDVKTTIESLKKVYKGDASVIMGHPSKIEIHDDSFNTTVSVSLGGMMGKDLVKVKLTSDKMGSITLEVPKGDIKLISKSGDVSVKTKSGSINLEGMDINIKAKNKIRMEAGSTMDLISKVMTVKPSASYKLKTKSAIIKGTMVEIKGSVFKASSSSIFLGNGAVHGVSKGPLLYSWAISHTHITSPTGGVSNVALPVLGFNSVSTRVVVK